MAGYIRINFIPCCKDLDVISFIADNPSNYTAGQTVIYNDLCYTIQTAIGFVPPPGLPFEPAYGGVAGGGPYLADTAYLISDENDCTNSLCPENECGCYTLTSCNEVEGVPVQIINTVTNLFEYLGQYIRIEGSEECFFVELSTSGCKDPVSVIVADGPYVDCPSCQNTCYLATNCFDEELTFILNVTNPGDIGATNSLSIEPGDIIVPGRVPTSIGDFDNCWTLELTECPDREVVEYAVTNTFQSCEDCRILEVPPCYVLTDCITQVETIYSGTLLSNYVGKTIQVVINDEVFCYSVTEAEECPEVTPPVFSLIIADCLDTCEECLPKCICSSAVNGSEIAVALRYIGCDGLEAFTEVVQPGARSERTCMIGFADANATDIYQLGTCTDGQCPSIPKPARKVKPGYDSPVCSAEKYEKIVCRYAEIMYKHVLQSRYGISDCCDEDDLVKREIEFDLLMLDVLNDPDYECTETNSNCGSCGYISTTIYYTECVEPEPELFQYRLTVATSPNPASGSLLSYIDENGLNPLITIVDSKGGYELIFCAEYGSITLNESPYYAANEPCPTPPCASVSGLTLERIGDCVV